MNTLEIKGEWNILKGKLKKKVLKELKALIAEAEKIMADTTVDPSSEDHINLGERLEAATEKVSEVYQWCEEPNRGDSQDHQCIYSR